MSDFLIFLETKPMKPILFHISYKASQKLLNFYAHLPLLIINKMDFDGLNFAFTAFRPFKIGTPTNHRKKITAENFTGDDQPQGHSLEGDSPQM
jgi:hypothetical protein